MAQAFWLHPLSPYFCNLMSKTQTGIKLRMISLEIILRIRNHQNDYFFPADVLRTMPSKAIELATFDLYKKFLIPGDPSNGVGGFLTSVAGAMAGLIPPLLACDQNAPKAAECHQEKN